MSYMAKDGRNRRHKGQYSGQRPERAGTPHQVSGGFTPQFLQSRKGVKLSGLIRES